MAVHRIRLMSVFTVRIQSHPRASPGMVALTFPFAPIGIEWIDILLPPPDSGTVSLHEVPLNPNTFKTLCWKAEL
jgi:hypothetical protein